MVKEFGAACNQGAQISQTKYLLFLNPDTLLFTDSLVIPINVMEKNSDIGIVGIQLIDSAGKIQKKFPSTKKFICEITGLEKIFPKWFSGTEMNYW